MSWISWPAHQESSSVRLSQPTDHKCVLPHMALGLGGNSFIYRTISSNPLQSFIPKLGNGTALD